MLRYVLKRLLLLIPVLLGVSFIIFTIMSLQPGDPGRMILGSSASQEAVDMLNHQLGVDRPFFTRYFSYLYNAVVHQDLGTSYRTSQPVINDILSRIGTSFRIAFNGIAMAAVIGIPIGVLSAVKQYSAIDNFSRITAMLMAAIPPFWLAMMLVLVFALKLGWLPPDGIDSWKNFILPMITLGLPYSGTLLRMTRSTMLETIRADYIRTAKAKGVAPVKIIFGHALKNSLIPVITYFGPMLAYIVTGSLVVEQIFAVPGIGRAFVSSITNRDYPMIMGTTIVLACLIVIMNLVSDILYKVVDPRITLE